MEVLIAFILIFFFVFIISSVLVIYKTVTLKPKQQIDAPPPYPRIDNLPQPPNINTGNNSTNLQQQSTILNQRSNSNFNNLESQSRTASELQNIQRTNSKTTQPNTIKDEAPPPPYHSIVNDT